MKCSCVLWIQTRGQYLRHGHQQLLYTHSTSPCHEVFMCLMNPNKRPISQTWTSTAPLHPFMSWSVHVSYESQQEANISDMDINSSFTPIHVMKCSCVLWIQTRGQYLRHGHQQLLYTHSCHEVFMCLMNHNKRPISQTWTSTAPLHPFMSWSVHVSYESQQEANISDMDINSSFTPIQPLHCPLTLSYQSKQEANISDMDINSSFTPIQPLHCPLTLLNLQKLGLGHSTQWYVVFSHGIYLLNKSLIRET